MTRPAPTPRPTRRRSVLQLGVLAAIWGTSFLFIKVGLEGVSAVQIVLGRLLAGAAVLLVIVAVRRQPLPRSPRTWGHLALMGLVANIVPFYLFAWGEQRASSSLAGIYNATTPLLTLLVAIAVLPVERPNLARTVGLLLGFLGVVTVLGPWRGLGAASVTGQLAFLGAAACYGVAFVYTRRYLSGSGHSPLVLATAQLVCAAAAMIVLSPLVATDPVRLPARVVLSVLALGAVGTGLAYLLYYGLIAELGATTASTVTYYIPIVAVTLGVVVLGEEVRWNDFVGAAIVVLGVAVAEGRLRWWPASRSHA
ncbi:MAG: DMT family transporter [Actinomycetota bacterium]|nr:DMT family transporter [Actinomycetota bacterium]